MDEAKGAHQPQSKLWPGDGQAGHVLHVKEVSQPHSFPWGVL